MKDMQNHCAGQHRALLMQGLIRGILVRLCGLGVMCAILCASGPVLADDEAIVVPRDFPTIQAAVDAAPPGATVKVRRGTYTEEIVITKDLHVEGAGVGATILQSPATLTPFAAFVSDDTETPLGAVVRITNGAKVRMFGFTVTGPVPCAVHAQGIAVIGGARLTLAESHVTPMLPEPEPSPCNASSGIRIGLPTAFRVGSQLGSTGHGKITDVIVDRYLGNGIAVAGPPGGAASTATISHSVVLGGTSLVAQSHEGITIRQNAVARVTENIVAGNTCTASFCGPDPLIDFQSSGILANEVGANSVEILNNHVFGNDTGIYQATSPHCCMISGNHVSNNRFFGIAIQDGDGATSENTITGGRVGIAVIAGTADTVGVLQGDRIRRASIAPVQEVECCGFTATAIRR
jgi:parallel beta-helix repeat protein